MTEKIVLGGGCFWCLEASFQLIEGIISVIPGYSGGTAEDAEYYKVASQTTGHAEVVEVTFDTSTLTLDEVLDIFWTIHDPTTLNRQGHDTGPEYRSVIFYTGDTQKATAETSIAKTQTLWDDPIVTELSPLDAFYPAEPEHHNYFAQHPEMAYCQIIINPKLQKLRQKFADRIKSDS